MEAISGILSTRLPKGNDSVKILNNSSISNDTFNLICDVKERVDKSALAKYMLHPGDVIILGIEPFKVAYIHEEGILATNSIYRIVDERLSSKEIYKLLNSNSFRNYLLKSIEGTGIKRLSSKHISEFKYERSDFDNAEIYYELKQLINNQYEKTELLRKLEKVICS